ncbi:H-NS histone family protein [uncultured Methylibium sp.]|uniref:H-NS histone family protein n=1 Tax=uncultured Methylibium sp. TaxID=381093 RepID=UPI0025F941E2|nr:H-NS histone family protein [uncultured Methylibium sp.]
MKTYASLQAEIAKLEKEAQALRKAEVGKVIASIKAAVATYGLTAADLGLNGSAKRRKMANGKKAATIGIAKYRDPKTGKTWTGRGKPPGWIAGAKSRAPYLIEKQAA